MLDRTRMKLRFPIIKFSWEKRTVWSELGMRVVTEIRQAWMERQPLIRHFLLLLQQQRVRLN